MTQISLGIDPGPINSGVCVSSFSPGASALLRHECFNFKGLHPREVAESVLAFCPEPPTLLTIERFVTYKGVQSDSYERTCILVGAIATLVPEPMLVRAIDWKLKIGHILYRQGFRNPSDKKDKKFSLAAAEFASGVKFDTDHEADAFLLSLYGYCLKGL
jgi:hypothetical protein